AQLIQEELKLISTNYPTQKEIEAFKRQLKGQILLGADDMENRMNSIGVNEHVFSSYRPVDLVIREIDKVNRDTVAKYIETYVKNQKPSLLMMGDLPESSAKELAN
ncbi:insulinase family protein, partial [bacterium]|nr:insulinase family protein [bacterium]